MKKNGSLLRCLAASALAIVALAAVAQTTAPAPAAPGARPAASAAAGAASGAIAAPTERAARDADRPLYWIRILADKAAANARTATPRPPRGAAAAALAAAAAASAAAAAPVAANAASAPRRTGSGPDGPPPDADPALARNAPSTDELVATIDASPSAAGGPVLATAGVSAGEAAGAAPAVAAGLAAPSLGAAAIEVPAPTLDDDPAMELVLTRSVDPDFGFARMRSLRKGSVEVRFEVGVDGKVAQATAVRSSHRSLESAALEAVRQWEFRPVPKARTAIVELAFDLAL